MNAPWIRHVISQRTRRVISFVFHALAGATILALWRDIGGMFFGLVCLSIALVSLYLALVGSARNGNQLTHRKGGEKEERDDRRVDTP